MPQSLVKNFVHIIFSTKKREPLITQNIETALHRYLGATCLNLNCHAERVGGYVDHVHLLCSLSKNISLSDFLKEVKQSSSKWMKSEHFKHDFYWQTGYAAFSVGDYDVKSVVDYIDRQHVHHRKHTFQEELRELLTSNHVAFDERYLWD